MSYTMHALTAAKGNMGALRNESAIKFLVIHYTGNVGDTAAANAKYFAGTVVQASAHYFVDDSEVWQSVPDDVIAWAVGGHKYQNSAGGSMYEIVNNSNSLSIEICGTGTGTSPSAATIENAVTLARAMMARYNIDVAHVVRHYDVTGKACPAWAVDGTVWADFKGKLAPVSSEADEAVAWISKAGIMTGKANGDMALNETPTRRQLAIMFYRLWKLLK